MIRELAGDFASDPPLGATWRTLAVARADDIVYGLGVLALERRARRLALVVRHDDAEAALRGAVARVGARVDVVRVADAWPPPLERPKRVVVDGRTLVAAADRARGRAAARWVTVAGAVAVPSLLRADGATVAALVAAAGGALDEDWVAVAGGAPAGRLIDRDAALGDEALLLVLPAGHEVVRRLRTPLGDWLLRAASACEGCRACSDVCPAPLAPHAVVTTLASGRDDGVELARALGCTGCGLCDAVCPSSLSPRALVVDVRERLRAGAVAPLPAAVAPLRVGLDVALLTARLGLAPYDRPVAAISLRAGDADPARRDPAAPAPGG